MSMTCVSKPVNKLESKVNLKLVFYTSRCFDKLIRSTYLILKLEKYEKGIFIFVLFTVCLERAG